MLLKILTFWLFATFTFCVNAETLIIDMRSRVTVDNSNVYLADIVNDMHGDENLMQDVSKTMVMNIGNTNQFRKVNRDILSQKIRKSSKNISIVYSGAGNTYVKVKTQSYNIDEIINEITNKITDRLKNDSSEVSVKYSGTYRDISMPSGIVSYKYKLPESVIKKRIPVWLDLYVNSKHYQSIPIWFNASVIADVMVANSRIPAEERLNHNMMVLKKKDITLYKNQYISFENIENLRVKRDVLPGEVITERMIETLPPVFKGQLVKVVSTQNNITILVDGFSLDDGKLGEKVRIQRSGTNRIFTAVVNNPGQVTAIGI